MSARVSALCLALALLPAAPTHAGGQEAKPRPAQQLVDEGVARAKTQQKHVLVYFTASWCGWCHRFEKFLADPDAGAIMLRYFVPVKLVALENGEKVALENAGSRDLLKQMGSTGGIPYYFMLDAAGKKIGDANGLPDGTNIGHPYTAEEIRAFDAVLGRTAPRMTAAERAKISAYLTAVAKES